MADLEQEDVRASEEGEGGSAAEEKEEEKPQTHAGDPSDDVPTSLAEHIRPSFSLRGAWPKSLLDEGVLEDGGRGLVVCTIDVQVLNDTVQVMHSQIGMLRQTILDLRQGVETQRAAEAEELEIIRRKIDSLEGAALGSGHHEQESPPLENMDDIMAALRSCDEARVKETAARVKESAALAEESTALAKESAKLEVRLQHLESTVYGEVNGGVLGNEVCEEATNPATPAVVAETRDSSTKEVEGVPVLLEKSDRALLEFGDKAGASAVETGAAEGDAKEDETKENATKDGRTMNSPAKTIAMVGVMALCPKVKRLQSQVGSILERERAAKLAERVAALESMLAAENGKADTGEIGNVEAAAEEQRRKELVRLLRKADLLRNMLLPDGILSGGEFDTGASNSCWTQDREEEVGGVGDGGGAKRIAAEDGADGEDLLQRVHGRLAWLEVHATETLSSDATVAAASVIDNTLSNEQDGSAPGSNEEARAGDTNVGSPELHATANTILTSLGDEGTAEEASVGGLAVAPSAGIGHGGDLEGISAKIHGGDHVERLWRRMDDVERRIYRLAAIRVPSPSPAGEVTASDLRELSSSLKSGASALETRLEDRLLSVDSRIDALESTRTESTEVVAGGVAVLNVDAESRMQQMLTNVLENEIPLVRRNLENVQDRVSVLEAAATDKTDVGEPGLSAEEAASVAAEEIQARMIAEMSALEDRVDRRARDEARQAREEREAAEARGSMRRISSTVSAYTADLAARLEVLQSEHERQGTEVARATEEITAAEADLKNMGSELVGLGEMANSVSIVVDGKADQADVEALKQAMQRLDASVAAKARGAAAAARDAEAISALQVALKDMSASMEGSMRKLQQAQASAGTIKIKPILDRVVKELATAGLLPDADAGQGSIGKSMCLSCNRPMTVAGNQAPTRFSSQFRGTVGSRMEQVSHFPLQINKPAVVWRGGFKMPPPHSAHQDRRRSRRPESATSLGKRHPPLAGGGVGGAGLSSQTSDSRWSAEVGLTGNAAHDRLPGIPNMLASGGGEGGVDRGGGRKRGQKVVAGSLRTPTEAPHRGRFVQNNNGSIVGPHVVASLSGRKS